MFVLIYFPFIDLRRNRDDQFGRAPKPDWRADLGRGFVRNFGGVVDRNAKSFGLVGERAYLEFEHALAFPRPGAHRQADWTAALPLRLWFRRMYFDGDVTGRFELGFRVNANAEQDLFEKGASPYDIGELARSLSEIPVEVRSGDGSRTTVALARCGDPLGLAYLVATTLTNRAAEFPAHDLSGTMFNVGSPSIHVRIGKETPFDLPRDRHDIVAQGDDQLFVTSVAKSQRRNTVMAQVSSPYADESAGERARRVLFAHLNAMLYANDFLVAHMDRKMIADHRLELKDLTARAIDRLHGFRPTGPKVDGDWRFAGAMRAFADRNAGRIDEIVEKLDTLAKQAEAPSRLQKIGAWAKGWAEFVTNSAIEAGVKTTLSPG